MRKAVKYICNAGPIYIYFKKHHCPKCGMEVEVTHITKIVNSKSPEAKNYDFSISDTFLVGDVEFRTKCFYCKNCHVNILFEEMKNYEKSMVK